MDGVSAALGAGITAGQLSLFVGTMALAILSTNYPNERFGPVILLYLLVNGIAAVPYLKWQEKQISPPHGVVRA